MMDPDIPFPSIEQQAHSHLLTRPVINTPSALKAAASTPLPASSPARSPFRTPRPSRQPSSPHSQSRSASNASPPSHERQPSPNLHEKSSASNLSASRGPTPSKPLFRRASSNLKPTSPVAMKSTAYPFPESQLPPTVTPGSVAREYFRKELDSHPSRQTQVALIVHDSCYGHRFSRPRTSKAALSTIVERPERIHATLLGASTAYVRLGGRHEAAKHPPHPLRDPSQIPNVPFRISKTSRFVPLSHPAVTHVHGTKWMEELQIMCDSAESKLAINGKELTRPIGYGMDENGNALPKLHEGDLYLCSESLSALQGCLGGVCDAVDLVLGSSVTKRAFVCIRPPGHHCSSNFPSGFCWLNNVHVGISYAAINHDLTHAAIIDFDLHHGDGSQTITWDHNRDAQTLPKHAAAHKKTPIGYYSLHDINSYPCEWGDEDKVRNASMCIENAHGQSIWNVHLEPWKTEEEFWKLYGTRYVVLLDKAKAFLRHHTARIKASGTTQPKAAVFLSAGFDASEWESAGMQRHKVNVPTGFYARFTADVVRMSHEPDLGVDGRVISVLEGGYSDRALTSGVLSHMCGMVGRNVTDFETGLYPGLASSLAPFANDSAVWETKSPTKQDDYDVNWWAESNLEAIEALVAGYLPPPVKASKDKGPGNYTSQTQSSTARMTDQARERRSLSAQLEARLSLEQTPVAPPPEVDWVTASYELSRLIIPDDRQTLSCKHDELNAEATRIRRERQSAVGLPSGSDIRMQLRDRRTKADPAGPEPLRATSRNGNRRTTIAAVSELPDPSFSQFGETASDGARSRRRSSAASSILSSFQDMKLSDRNDKDRMIPDLDQRAVSNVPATTLDRQSKPPIVKKSRAPATKPAAKSRSSPKKPTSTTATRSRRTSAASDTILHKNTVSTSDANEPIPSIPSQYSRLSNETEHRSDELDSITNALKKVSIKLKVPTAEEHAAKQKQAEEEKRTKVRQPRKPAIPKAPKMKDVIDSRTGSVALSAPIVRMSEPMPEAPTFVAPTADATTLNSESAYTQPSKTDPPPSAANTGATSPAVFSSLTESEMPTSRVSQADMEAGRTNGEADRQTTCTDTPTHEFQVMDSTEAMTDSKHPASQQREEPISRPQQQPYTSMAPPALTPSEFREAEVLQRVPTPTKRAKDDLPKFTSTSPIPFATGPQQWKTSDASERKVFEGREKSSLDPELNVNNKAEEAAIMERSIWDLPERPHGS